MAGRSKRRTHAVTELLIADCGLSFEIASLAKKLVRNDSKEVVEANRLSEAFFN
jgi:hypothetical protein